MKKVEGVLALFAAVAVAANAQATVPEEARQDAAANARAQAVMSLEEQKEEEATGCSGGRRSDKCWST